VTVSVLSRARRRALEPQERWFLAGVLVITLVATWCRVAGLSHGSFYRDDAWVALTSRVPWHDAWRMVGTAPGFVLFERWWVGLTAWSTWWAQIPTLVVSVIAVPLMAIAARWWGLSRAGALLAAALIAVSRVNIEYATHLKPYAHDLVAGIVIVTAAEWWRRGRSAWPFAILSLLCLATSFSVAPVVVGCGVVMAVLGWRSQRWRSLVAPGAVVVILFGLLYWRVHNGISPRLKQSWYPNFLSYDSLHAFVHSISTIVDGFVWGFSDTTPHIHVVGASKLVIAFVLVAVIVGATRLPATVMALASVIGAGLFAALHVAPLGTGRTDAYLYPAVALLVCFGVEASVRAASRWRRDFAVMVMAGVIVLVGFVAVDQVLHRPSYPGGSITPVATAANDVLADGGGVLIEGTARWPWTYYEVRHVHLRFSNLYNTGFAPLSDDPRVFIMPGTVIEGGYDPVAAVHALRAHATLLYVRTDDWPTLGDPLRQVFRANCYYVYRRAHPAGYLLEWLHSSCKVPSDGAVASLSPSP
jgi:hypothetical protein